MFTWGFVFLCFIAIFLILQLMACRIDKIVDILEVLLKEMTKMEKEANKKG